MKSPKKSFLVGLITPEILQYQTPEILNEIHHCDVLEIRYDFFENKEEWPFLAAAAHKIHPAAKLLGTIRLIHDGGKCPENFAGERLIWWKKILNAAIIPDWLDIEQDHLKDYMALARVAGTKNVGLLLSKHDFKGIPSARELHKLVSDGQTRNAIGIKIAAMSHETGDCEPLYAFAREFSPRFKLFSAFAMGSTGTASRIWSLAEGANITYGALDTISVPGQLKITEMQKSLDFLPKCHSEIDVSQALKRG